ncbi:hypothetical protein [Allonocardiopsis opalescens]|uniref:Uncharacterized protein n=1 Tax=Allonocardiopsis opalescens TaxID=1144618 RepID=A0A2T0PPJ3_9ACTN|nr:hypothetical protein [Allonocardiopsis opalescens]PRX90825.1 hypothetical protein CLV72_11621 [Allonocardiopsis opalescens]
MAIIAAQSVPVAGLAEIVWGAAAGGGDEAPVGGGLLLLVRNIGAGSLTATIATPRTVRGIPIADVALTVAAGDVAAVPMDTVYRSPSTGRASITYDVATDAEVAVLRVAR